MELSRRQTLSVLGVTAAAAVLPASAAKAVTQPEFLNVIYFPDNEARVLAYVRCAVPVVSVTARLFNHERTAQIAEYQMQLGPDGNPLSGLWRTAPLTGIPLGNYWMEYEATSADGGVAGKPLEFFLWLTPTYTVAVTPAAIDETHRVITVGGTVVGRHPLTGEVAPIAGLPVRIEANYWPTYLPNPPHILAVSASDGTYGGQLTLAGAALISVETGGEPRDVLVSYSGPGSVTIPIDKLSARLTANVTATVVNRGEPTTVSGLLEAFSDGQWRPLAGRVIWLGFVFEPGDYLSSWIEVTTDAQGRFLTAVTPLATGHYKAMFDDRFYTPAAALTAAVVALLPVRFGDQYFSVTRSRLDGLWDVRGDVDTPSAAQPVEIQFRRSAAEGWQTLKTVIAGPSTSMGGYPFTARIAPPTAGQVRAYAAPTATTQAGSSKLVFVSPPLAPERPEYDAGGDPVVPQRPLLEDDGPARRP